MMQTSNVICIPWNEVTPDVPFVLQGRVNPEVYAQTINQLRKIRHNYLATVLPCFGIWLAIFLACFIFGGVFRFVWLIGVAFGVFVLMMISMIFFSVSVRYVYVFLFLFVGFTVCFG
jgi:hypothetical protein